MKIFPISALKSYCGGDLNQGLHFASRLHVSHNATKKDSFLNAASAYSEQLGVKRQHEPRSGLMQS